MKIKCEYCEHLFNDTLEQCPHCGAPNSAVVRKSGDQPITIEELKKWYSNRGLPPYEITRFFVGVDYRKPRAFGIYRDESTGNFIVYKNKDNGQRSIRYEGTDEAYAVNELFNRLKQEIIQQKNNQAGKHTDIKKNQSIKKIKRKFGVIATSILLSILLFINADYLLDIPKTGYYSYNSDIYYALDSTSNNPYAINYRFWFVYNKEKKNWESILKKSDIPNKLVTRKKSKKYFLSKEWKRKYGVIDFFDSDVYNDALNSYTVSSGYYDYSGTVFYHLTDYSTIGWYYFDELEEDWYNVEESSLPDALVHTGSSADFYYTPTWDSTTQITDFTDTDIYKEYQESQKEEDNWDNENDDDDYDWDDDWDWDSDDMDWDSDW